MAEDNYRIRTDLAVETQDRMQRNQEAANGVKIEKDQRDNDTSISTVTIETENAAKELHRPRGHYVTLENPHMSENDAEYHREISIELARCIRRLLPDQERNRDILEDLDQEIDYAVLIAGLGNRQVTPDALGPAVVDHLYITRHIIREFGKYAFGKERISKISAIVPGVMAQTGMECVEILRGVVEQTRPDLVLTVDALAARSMRRLGRTVQLTDTGITPGSGIGNHRNAINKESIGVPVISIGIPTVVDAATIVSDAVTDFIEAARTKDGKASMPEEPFALAQEILSPQPHGMFVTPKDIDESIGQLSFLLSEAINIAFLGNKQEQW